MNRLAILIAFLPCFAFANVKFSFNNEELPKMIESYSKATGQKFVVDPGVRGKATINGADSVSEAEAFNLLSSALAVNGYAISKQGDTMTIMNARNIQRSLVDVSKTLPELKPERMTTWVYTFKYISAAKVGRDMRILSSKDGEMSVFPDTNQVVLTDWTSNLQRVSNIFKELDVQQDPKLAKFAKDAERMGPPMPPPHPPGRKRGGMAVDAPTPPAPPAPPQMEE